MHALTRASVAATTLFMSYSALAADCLYQKNTVDPFTKQAAVVTEWEQMTKDVSDKFKHPKGFVSLIRDGNQKFLAIRMRTWEESRTFSRSSPGPIPPDSYLYNAVVADAGSKLLLLLADETIIELQTDRTVHGIANSTGVASSGMDPSSRTYWNTYNIRTTTTLRYPLHDDAYVALGSFPVKNIRLSTNRRDYDFLLRNDPYGGVSRALGCIGADTVAEEGA